MSSCSRVALVTGANKGIGFATARDLCRQFPGDVVLTARDAARGQAAVQQLQAEGLSPRFHLLDICNRQSIGALRDFLVKEYGGLDVLVNNAGIAFWVDDPTPLPTQAEVTMKTNFFGSRDVCTELLPLVRPQGRVVNVSSILSLVALKNCSPELQQKFTSETITEEELVGLMNKFVEDTKNGVHLEEGWPHMIIANYAVTKLGITVLSRIQARKLSEQRKADKILLNSCCPGWVRTNLGGPKALKSPEEGAETPVYLALLPSDADGPHGQFIMEKKVEQWEPSSELPPWLQLSWDAARGQTAVQQLQAEGLSPRFHLLDICNRQSIRALRDFLLKEYGGLDVLVNNAASPSRTGHCWLSRQFETGDATTWTSVQEQAALKRRQGV
ncbi:hypothetical protein MC885_019310 [Smutsia gigantea]|nr:hypothetical protein MC885_019310 [Smutsia gigantea]